MARNGSVLDSTNIEGNIVFNSDKEYRALTRL